MATWTDIYTNLQQQYAALVSGSIKYAEYDYNGKRVKYTDPESLLRQIEQIRPLVDMEAGVVLRTTAVQVRS